MASLQPAYVRGKQAAQALRLREQLGFGAVDIWQLLDHLDIPVALHEFGDSGGDGLYLWEHSEPFIVVNASRRLSRQRFTAAHELGHHEMHRFDGDRLLITDHDVTRRSSDAREIEANAFAAYFLAPDEAVRRGVGDDRGEKITKDHVIELMGVFGLSYRATTWRLLNAEVINQAQQAALATNPAVEAGLRRAGIDEDNIFKPPPRLPRTHVNHALRLYEDHVVSPNRLGELLDMTPSDALTFAEQRDVRPTPELPVDEAAVDELLRGL
ncbi:MAG: ImmA/IrrE family metallo-endopeptidase [Solirubrobacteraceae bacterium]